MMDPISKSIHRTAVVSAALGAVLSPIPLIDELLLFPIYAGLAARIGSHHGLAASQLPWRPVLRTAFNGLLARAGLNLAVAYIPGVAAVANAASAAVLTEVFGRYADRSCSSPAEARAIGIREIGELLRQQVAAWKATTAA